MRYELKNYQRSATADMLEGLTLAQWYLHNPPPGMDPQWPYLTLSAPTGSGKTVIAAAVLEALLCGAGGLGEGMPEFEADPGAVVIWFSDDPALNIQSRNRIESASDRLAGRLEIIDTDFTAEELEAGKVYLLNAQKLSKSSTLVRGADRSAGAPPPDTTQRNFYDVLAATQNNEHKTVYLVLDEAHRGMRRGSANTERQTIVRRLISGHHTGRQIPVVVGISATTRRFTEVMADATGRVRIDPVEVDLDEVQESGLLKDVIVLASPGDDQQRVGVDDFETVLIADAVKRTRAQEERWAKYTDSDPDAPEVLPLLVVQVGDKINQSKLGLYLETIYTHWPELRGHSHAIANVFGEHEDLQVGDLTIPYVEPQRVQADTEVRVLLAKMAISTGWDCPRAEVMVSLRGGNDEDYITQLLGRLLRSPLARRISGNEELNTVHCLLPHFDHESVEKVAGRLTRTGALNPEEIERDGTGGGKGRKVLTQPVTLEYNSALDDAVWEAVAGLQSATVVRTTASPLRRLAALATELAFSPGQGSTGAIDADAVGDVVVSLADKVRGLLTTYDKQVTAGRKDLMEVTGAQHRVLVGSGSAAVAASKDEDGVELPDADEVSWRADDMVITTAFRAASRRVYAPYGNALVKQMLVDVPDDEFGDEMIELYTDLVALAQVEEAVEELQSYADTLREKLLTTHRRAIAGVTNPVRVERFRVLRGKAGQPVWEQLVIPELQRVQYNQDSEWLERHLLADEHGRYPAVLNTWERDALDGEYARKELLAWYRNPSSAEPGAGGFGIPYQMDGKTRILRPDFLFFHSGGGPDEVVVDVVDPHGDHLADALPKLVGLAQWATGDEALRRGVRTVEATAVVDGRVRMLALHDAEIAAVVLEAASGGVSAKELYLSHGEDLRPAPA